MKLNPNIKSTKTMKAVEASVTLAECCEGDCKMSIMVDKEELAQGRKVRCTACTMKSKITKAFG